ncbi:MAG: flagellar basal body-associated FliL family protein [Alphaproteobacteria bacterium]|nr:flagellar basal body-associated FliL family protein [Alphaproteobacteria bacterium]
MSDAPTPAENDDTITPIDDGGGKKKKILLILIPLLLLIGGGAGLYFSGMLDKMLGKAPTEETGHEGKDGDKKEGEKADEKGHGESKDSSKETSEGKSEKGHGESKEGGKEEGKKGEKKESAESESAHPADAVFMKIPDLIVNLASSGSGPQRYLRLSVQLELANEEDQKKVEMVLPRVIDQFQTYLRELRVEDLKGSKGIYRLQMELLARVNAAASPVEVKDILFQEILIQ